MKEQKDLEFLAFSIMPGIIPSGSLRGTCAMIVEIAGCNLRCKYCSRYGITRKDDVLNSIRYEDAVKELEKYPHITNVFITGGEPMLRAGQLERFISKVKEMGYKVYLETNGTRPFSHFKTLVGIDRVVIRPKVLYNKPFTVDDLKEHESKENKWDYYPYYINYAQSYEFRYEVGTEMDVEIVRKHIADNHIPASKVWLTSRKDVDLDAIALINEMLKKECLKYGFNFDE